mgnify:CR=1 FL=1
MSTLNDDIATAIQLAGPINWHHLLAPTRSKLDFGAADQAFGNYLATHNRHPNTPGNAIAALGELATVAIIIANNIANDIFTTTAQDVFQEAYVVAREFDRHAPKPLSWPQTNNDAYRAARKILRSDNTRAHAMLLVDIIRAANQLANQ